MISVLLSKLFGCDGNEQLKAFDEYTAQTPTTSMELFLLCVVGLFAAFFIIMSI